MLLFETNQNDLYTVHCLQTYRSTASIQTSHSIATVNRYPTVKWWHVTMQTYVKRKYAFP